MRDQLSVVLLLCALTAAGCGGGDDDGGKPAATPTSPPAVTATVPPAATATVPPAATATVRATATTEPATPAATATASPTATPTDVATGVMITSPALNAEVTTFAFDVAVELAPNVFDPATLVVKLNDVPLTLVGGPTMFSATVQPGAPLRDDNALTVTVRTLGGVDVTLPPHPFAYLPPKASARRITEASDFITGPLAHGRIGDYHLGNAVARFVIQDAPKRDMWSVGAFGGNLIDAELIGHPGLDNFLEIQPGVNLETVINAQTVEIVNDGQDGTAAIVRACGPDDVLDFVNPSTIIEDAGLTFPASANDHDDDVEGCTEYILEPGRRDVKMVTTILNNEDADLGLFVGDFINASGEVEQWTSSGIGLGEQLVNTLGVMSFIGYNQATGVDYAHITLPVPDSRLPGSTFFTAAGVSYVLQSASVLEAIFGMPPTFVVPANGSKSFTRHFAVGDGSGSNAIDLENELKAIATGTVRGCVTVGGAPAPAARVSIGPVVDGSIGGVTSVFVTDAAGCYRGTLPPGEYGIAAARRGTLYENGQQAPLVHPVTIAVGGDVTQNFALPATGRLRATVVDETGAPVPARVAVIGFDPSPEPVFASIGANGPEVTGLFNDISVDRDPYGVVQTVYAGADGVAEIDVEPGSYQVVVSRGVEYSLYSAPLAIVAGQTAAVGARIARVVDTTGFISSDYHVHGINSADARVSHRNRAMQYAGEGVDNIIMTDHHSHTDLNPTIAGLSLASFVHATIGEEITTWDYGHFNAYPFTIDPARPSGGSTDWGRAAPAGRDFVAYGAYSATPAELAALATDGPQSTPDTVIQINHINSFFDPLRIDTSLVPPRSFISEANKLRFRLDPATENLFHHFPALELWNGASRGAQREFLNDRIGIWFNHLNQGLLTTAIADTDSHQFTNLNAAGGRTWTAASSDDPADVDPGEVGRSVAAGRAVGGQGAYVQARLVAADGSNAVADLGLEGSTVVASSNRAVDLEIRVQAPAWAPYDRIEIYANAATTATLVREGVPVLFKGVPTRVLNAGADFTVETVDVVPAVPGATRLQTMLTVPFADLATDTWFVVVVRGTDGVSQPMFPVMVNDIPSATNTTLENLLDGNLGEGGVLALGYTNALYADVDGVPGFQAPLAQ